MASMRILVTGATGFIGRHLVRTLAASGHEVLSCSRSSAGPPGASLHVPHDFASRDPLPDLGRLDSIVHLAGISGVEEAAEDPAQVAQVNAQGTLQAILMARQAGATFILASSQRIYQRSPQPLGEDAPKEPSDVYACTKLAAELYTEMAGRFFGVPGAVLRFFSVYGQGQLVRRGTSGAVSILAQRALQGEPLVVMSRHRRDFVHVTDAVAAIRQALAAPRCPPAAYNVGTGQGTTIRELAERILSAAGGSSPIVEDYSSEEPDDLVADIARARREIGYEPRVTLDEGLRTHVEGLRTAGADPAQGPSDARSAR